MVEDVNLIQYVWLCYGFAALVISGMVITTCTQYERVKLALKNLEEDNAPQA